MNSPVNRKLSKLLKDKHSDIRCLYYWLENSDVSVPTRTESCIEMNWNAYTSNYRISAPTIGQVVMWLYKKHGVWIEVRRTSHYKEIRFQSYINEKPLVGDLGGYVSHEEPSMAYEAAIEHALDNLI